MRTDNYTKKIAPFWGSEQKHSEQIHQVYQSWKIDGEANTNTQRVISKEKADLRIFEPPLSRCRRDLELKTSPEIYLAPMIDGIYLFIAYDSVGEPSCQQTLQLRGDKSQDQSTHNWAQKSSNYRAVKTAKSIALCHLSPVPWGLGEGTVFAIAGWVGKWAGPRKQSWAKIRWILQARSTTIHSVFHFMFRVYSVQPVPSIQ